MTYVPGPRTPAEVESRLRSLQAAAKIVCTEAMQAKADLSKMEPKPPKHILDAMHRTLFHMDTFADNLYQDIEDLFR